MVIDLTLPLEDDMPLFPGLPTFDSEANVSEETGALTHRLHMSSHQGTHVDAPRHYDEDGKTLDEVGLETLRGEATIVDLREHRGDPISAEVLETADADVSAGDFLVLITGDVDERFYDEDFFTEASALTADAAEWLVDKEVSVVANDFLSEGIHDPERPVHNTVLGAGIPFVEYIANTDAIADRDTVDIVCAPLHLKGFEAAPARVFVSE
ncbi:cyclase family protein [Halorussus salinisoli]|uniref:cyclase family protein n=1 Tax=Halorussus salinisoli TaxID=2558242 RepID=UPI0010C1A731|nr:cyclase family protein [Halorussus salinisoli]